MRSAAWFSFIIMAAANVYVPAHAQDSDDDLRVYAVTVINTSPFKPFRGYGIYLAHGMVITAAHVVGRWALFENPRVRIAGEELPASVIKKGSFAQTDLALLSVNEASLPSRLRLRRNPLCKAIPNVGTNVVVVSPERTARSRIFSPRLISPMLRTKYNTLLSEVQGSGAGAFDAERKCLLGIMSASVATYRGQNGRAEYFVPVAKIADFLPAKLRF